MNNELSPPFWIEVALFDAIFVVGHKQLTFDGIFLRIQNEPSVDDTPWQWKHIERTMNQVIPFTSNIQTSNFTVASGFIFNCKKKERKRGKTNVIDINNLYELIKCVEYTKQQRKKTSSCVHKIVCTELSTSKMLSNITRDEKKFARALHVQRMTRKKQKTI